MERGYHDVAGPGLMLHSTAMGELVTNKGQRSQKVLIPYLVHGRTGKFAYYFSKSVNS